MKYMKICSDCGFKKAEKEFNFKDKDKGKLNSKCKICTKKYYKRYYKLNSSKVKDKVNQNRYKYTKRDPLDKNYKYKNCFDCGKVLTTINKHTRYCFDCRQNGEKYLEEQRQERINKWLSGELIFYTVTKTIKKYFKELYDNKCSQCGWGEINSTSGVSYIEIDHIDGDRTNNKIENLRYLCPNCHSLTSNYKYLKGR